VHSPVPPRSTLTRRTALGVVTAGSAAALVGCTPSGIDRRPRKNASAPPTRDADPDVALAATVLADEQAMLDLVAATVARHPALEARLATAREAHQAHVDLLTRAVPKEARVSPAASPPADTSPSVSPSVSPSPTGSPTGSPTVPARRPRAVAALAEAEDRLALVGRRSAFATQSGAFARVLAGMSASAAQHAIALGDTGELP
jgi:hypothetical protein